MGVLCGQASVVEILLCEGGDVELVARTSKHILLFALDPLALTLSLSLYCALHQFILFIHNYLLGLFECASIAVIALVFKFRIKFSRLALSPIHPP